ncbi:hypothetical protein [Bacillus xiapuensis]|uniref:Uncharacterized protein n=1 Tax=Bacillus xiapuensis TaxID=2014075 RepID=A0ABU6N7X0_9BACI|nr:hypothetical protein [Bacillus xiapuensis]
MQKVVISGCYGGFEPNKKFQNLLNEKGLNWWEIKARTDKDIIKFVEDNFRNDYQVDQLGKENYQYVNIAEVDTSISWTIEEYDGAESIHYIKYKVIDPDLNYCEYEYE